MVRVHESLMEMESISGGNESSAGGNWKVLWFRWNRSEIVMIMDLKGLVVSMESFRGDDDDYGIEMCWNQSEVMIMDLIGIGVSVGSIRYGDDYGI